MWMTVLSLVLFGIIASGGVMNQLLVAGKAFGGKRKDFGTFFLFLFFNGALTVPFVYSFFSMVCGVPIF